jgi:hypothetical protein
VAVGMNPGFQGPWRPNKGKGDKESDSEKIAMAGPQRRLANQICNGSQTTERLQTRQRLISAEPSQDTNG